MKMLARQRVSDYLTWRAVFDSHAEAQKDAGLRLEGIWRNLDSPSDVFALFEVEDEALARAFVTSPAVPEAKRQSGVIGETEIVFLGTSENLSNPS